MSDDTHMYAVLSVMRIARALRQIERLKGAYRTLHDETEKSGHQSGWLPHELAYLQVTVNDEEYFAIVAVNQAIKAGEVLRQRGEDPPQLMQAAELAAWRNFEEHWDDPASGMPLRALDRWRSLSDASEPGLTLGAEGSELTDISGVDVRQLVRDLTALWETARQVSEREWRRRWLTAEEAAARMGMSVDEFTSLPRHPSHMDFEGTVGIRYMSESVDQHALVAKTRSAAKRIGPPPYDR